jgi:hypothetical protein
VFDVVRDDQWMNQWMNQQLDGNSESVCDNNSSAILTETIYLAWTKFKKTVAIAISETEVYNAKQELMEVILGAQGGLELGLLSSAVLRSAEQESMEMVRSARRRILQENLILQMKSLKA